MASSKLPTWGAMIPATESAGAGSGVAEADVAGGATDVTGATDAVATGAGEGAGDGGGDAHPLSKAIHARLRCMGRFYMLAV